MQSLAVFCIVFAAWQASKTTIGPIKGADVGQLISALKRAGAAPSKTEFETTAEFESRRHSIPDDWSHRLVLVPAEAEGGIAFSYDADVAVMRFGAMPFMRLEATTHKVLFVFPTQVKTTNFAPYEGSNAFGAKKAIQRISKEEKGISVSGTSIFSSSFPLDVAKAKELKPYLCLGFAGTVAESVVYHGALRHEPTMTEPSDSIVNGDYVPVRLDAILIMDRRNGDIIANLPFQQNRR